MKVFIGKTSPDHNRVIKNDSIDNFQKTTDIAAAQYCFTLPDNEQIITRFKSLLKKLSTLHEKSFVAINYDQSCCTILFNKDENENILKLLHWLISNTISLINNPVCSYNSAQVPPSMQTITTQDPSASQYTKSDCERLNQFERTLMQNLLDTKQKEIESVADAIGKFAMLYSRRQHNSYHKAVIPMSTGQPGFKPFFHSQQPSFIRSIADDKDENYAKYGSPEPGSDFTQLAVLIGITAL